jgi:site-specific recombinase XerD
MILHNGESINVTPCKKMELAEATQQFIIAYTGIKKNELREYRYTFKSLTAYTGNLPIESVTVTTLRGWRSTLSGQTTLWSNHPTKPAVNRPLSQFTIHGHVSRCRRFFQWLVDEEHLLKSPARRLELPKLSYKPQDISEADIDRMIGAAGTARDRAIIMILIESGCRVGGLVGLTLMDLELHRCRAWAVEKGDKGRYIYFSPQTADDIKLWLQERPVDSQQVFRGKKGQFTTSGVYQVLKRLARKAGVKRFNPHSFRHATARRMIRQGASMEDVSAVLGHSTCEVTKMFYAPWDDAEIQRRHTRFAMYRPDSAITGD